ncbi:DUF2764 family protein [Rhabdochlamydiaceae symbiont of Dictyostelium giganteum]|uniref:DUF2764 family protein n=1 Tax=Rhabdochlamydiaceae symbiont of Dictyostelium giganteum TaxID=3342349 RepID=UPI00384C8749
MSHYYFLTLSLPPLRLGEKAPLSFSDLMSRIELNVTASDFQKLAVLRRWIDLKNIRPLYLGETIDPRGNLNEKELEEALLIKEFLPAYVFDFLEKFESREDKLRFLPHLLARYLQEEERCCKGFLQSYFSFERSWRCILLAIKAKELGKDVEKELQFEDLKDPLIIDILAQKEAPIYEPPLEFMSLKEKYLGCGLDPWELVKMGIEWKFDQINHLIEKDLFSMDVILAYVVQLMMIEEFNELDSSRGEIILEAFVG